MMTKRVGILALVIIALAVFWMRPEKRSAGRNADAGSFILSAHAQTSNYGGVSITSFAANCVPIAPTASSLACGALSDNGTTVNSTEPILLPNGTAANPAIGFTGTANLGIYNSSSLITFSQGSSNKFSIQASDGVQVASNGIYGFSNNSGSSLGSIQSFFRSRSAANFTFGSADLNGTPVAQTLSVQNAITGTDLPGKQFSLAGSLGTGAALPLPIVLQGADASVGTGTTAQTEISRFVSADTKNLTTGAATTLLSIPLATLQTTGGLVFIHMEATDGTNQCTLDDLVTYAAENSAGVFVVNTSKMGTGATACTATKSLTATYAVTSANPALLQVTPTLTGITATRFTAVYTVMHGGMTNPTL